MEGGDGAGDGPDKIAPVRIPSPEPAHLPRDSGSEDEREATELAEQTAQPRLSSVLGSSTGRPPKQHWYDPVKKAWRHHVRISVPHVDCRDHLANERTFLGYVRTSGALSMLGVVVLQLWRLQQPSAHPNAVLGYYVLSKPIALALHATALCNVLLGCIRFFRQQSAMARGRVHAGGWEVLVIMLFTTLIGVEINQES